MFCLIRSGNKSHSSYVAITLSSGKFGVVGGATSSFALKIGIKGLLVFRVGALTAQGDPATLLPPL